MGADISRSGTTGEPTWPESIRIATKHVNEGLAGTRLKDREFEFVVSDSQTTASVAVTRAVELVQQGVKGIVVDTSAMDEAVHKTFYDADAANDLNVPLVCTACSAGTLNNPTATNADPVTQATYRNDKKWNFRAIMDNGPLARAMVSLLLRSGNNGDVNGDGVFKLSIYAQNNVFGKSMADGLEAAAKALHPNPAPVIERIYVEPNVDLNSYNFAADLQKVVDDKNQGTGATDGFPDAIGDGLNSLPGAAVTKAYKNAGFTIRFLHNFGFANNTNLQSLGSLAENEEGIGYVRAESSASGAFYSSELERESGSLPGYVDAQTYDSAVVLMLASLIAGANLDDPSTVTGEQVRAAIPLTSVAEGEKVYATKEGFARAAALIAEGKPINYEGASGPVDFDANGRVQNRAEGFKIQGGKYVAQGIYDCIQNPATCPLAQ